MGSIETLKNFLRSFASMERDQLSELRTIRTDLSRLADAIEMSRTEQMIRGSAVIEGQLDRLIGSSPRYDNPRCINHCYGQVYSQNNEDGIIAEIFRRVGVATRTCVEIAAGNGIENNTRLLLELGWRGLWVEAGSEEVRSLRSSASHLLATDRLKFIEAFVDREGIDRLVADNADGELDLLSLDIDYNTSHLWSAIRSVSPRVVCIEYNAHFGASIDFEVPYDPAGRWEGTTRFGASLKALERIGRSKGYSLVGCDVFGVNAFFVRNDLCNSELFLAPFASEQHFEPPRYSWVHMRGHARNTAST